MSVIELFCILIAEMVIWMYTCVKTHRNPHNPKKSILLFVHLKSKILKEVLKRM